MSADRRTAADLLTDYTEVRRQLDELHETLEAIRSGAVDALVVAGEAGERVYTLEGAESAYRVLVETMDEGAATLSEDHSVLYCNARFAEMLGKPLERLMGSSLRTLVVQADLPSYDAAIGRALRDSGKCEVEFAREDGAPVAVQLSCSALDVQGARGVCVVATDLTEQKRNAETAAAERLARSILEQAADAIVVTDPDGRIIRSSHAAERLAGRSILLEHFASAFPIASEAGAEEPDVDLLTRVLAGEPCSAVEACVMRTHLPGTGQGDRRLSISAGPLRGAAGQVIGAVVSLVDVTDRRRAEQALVAARDDLQRSNEDLSTALAETQSLADDLRAANEDLDRRVRERTAKLRALAGELTRAEDRERQRIANLLHDDLQQLLFGARLQLETVAKVADAFPGRDALDHVRHLISESFDTARGITHELSPAALHQGSLTAGLTWLCQQMASSHGLAVRVRSAGDPEPESSDVRLVLYQAVRELLVNVTKHAGVPEADVRVRARGSDVQITVSDLGRGFDSRAHAEGSPVTDGLGLFSIRERLILVGGRLEISSTAGRGSRFHLFAPALQRLPGTPARG